MKQFWFLATITFSLDVSSVRRGDCYLDARDEARYCKSLWFHFWLTRLLAVSGTSHRPFYWKTHPFEFFDWIYIWYVTFGLDDLSSKTACVTPQNSPIDNSNCETVKLTTLFFKTLNRYSWFLMNKDEFMGKLWNFFSRIQGTSQTVLWKDSTHSSKIRLSEY